MINPSLTRGKYWLLEAVSESSLPICWLDWENLEEALNKTGHGMSRAQLVATLEKLFSEGLIQAKRFYDPDTNYSLSADEIEAALDERQDFKGWRYHHYQLTDKGGRYWEAFALPKWDRYIDAGFTSPDSDDGDNDICWGGK